MTEPLIQSRRRWPRRLASAVLMVAIFGWMARKVALHWATVRDRVGSIHVGTFLAASAMFAAFLFVFRALTWRRIVRGFGYELPLAPAVRVWSVSELARYVPGVIWQVAGRVYLVKPYGVPAAACAASQVLELILFLLANLLVALGCLSVFGLRHVHGRARVWFVVSAALVPLLLLAIHPRVFYGALDRVMRRLKKPPTPQRLGGGTLAALLAWNVAGAGVAERGGVPDRRRAAGAGVVEAVRGGRDVLPGVVRRVSGRAEPRRAGGAGAGVHRRAAAGDAGGGRRPVRPRGRS